MTPDRRERLRVLLFGRYADEDFGGIERHVRNLVLAMKDDVAFTNLVAWRTSIAQDDTWPCPVYRSRALGVVASLPLCPGMPREARRLHRDQHFQIAHLHLPDPMSHYAAVSLPREVKLVVTWHSDIVRQKSVFAFYRPMLKGLMARASFVIAPTPAHFDSMPQLASLATPEKRRVVPFGFDLERYRRPHPKASEIRQKIKAPMVFALGRHVYYKGFDVLIRAMQNVPGACLLLGGTGPLTGELKAMAGKNVHFVGRIPDEELPAYYQACDVYCLPSVAPSEAFGIVQVEAMAAGKPVICTQLDNGVNWVNPEGPTVPPGDVQALASALNEVLKNPPATKNAERADRLFSLPALREATLAVYREALRDQVVPA